MIRSKLNGIVTITAFDQDSKRLKKKHVNFELMKQALQALQNGDSDLLDTKYRDHALKGDWQGYRELHINDDWLLIYFIDDDDELVLVLSRTGSHDYLFSSRTNRSVIRSYKTAPRRSFGSA